ncbi:MAG: toll/interleukin-1 receptor domain-containing protein [Hyphomicrobiaceae bacterium]
MSRQRKKRRIFISYRRSDSADVSGRLYDWLALKFGNRCVIKDVYSIPPGVDFCDFIEDVVPNCSCMLAMIGPDWLAGKRNAPRSLKKTDDFVRFELQCALDNKIPVFPILVGGAKLPPAKQLPKELRGILKRNAVPLRSDPDFRGDADRLIAHL